MQIITGGRRTGRTTKLIQMAAESEAKGEICYIVCHSRDEAYRIHQKATAMRLSIGFPISYDEFLKGSYHGGHIKKFYIDNAEYLLQHISSVPIEAIVIRTDNA